MRFQIRSGVKTVTTAGTRVALSATDNWVIGLQISPPAANAGVVYLGDVTVAAANGRVVAAGAVVDFKDILGIAPSPEMLPRINLKDTYVDAATNGDKITFNYLESLGGLSFS